MEKYNEIDVKVVYDHFVKKNEEQKFKKLMIELIDKLKTKQLITISKLYNLYKDGYDKEKMKKKILKKFKSSSPPKKTTPPKKVSPKKTSP